MSKCPDCGGLGHNRMARCPKCEGRGEMPDLPETKVVKDTIKLPERGPVCIPEMQVWDASSMSDFQRCPFYYYNRYEQQLTPPWQDIALDFGGAIHEALAFLFLHPGDVAGAQACFRNYPGVAAMEDSRRNMANGEAIIEAYWARWKDETDIKVIVDEDGPFVERAFMLEVTDGERHATFAGRLDLAVTFMGDTYVMDHKTTSGMHYITNNLRPNLQFDGYTFAGEKSFGHCAGLIVDAIEMTAKGNKFMRIPTPRSGYEINQFAVQFLNVAEHIQLCQATGRWPRFTTHCWEYFKRCPYENLCMHDSSVGLEVRNGDTSKSGLAAPSHNIVV